MKKEHSLIRKIIVFSIFFVALGIVAPTIVFYSLGYRLDKDNNSVIQSGSVVVKSTPSSPKVLINGQEVAQRSIDLINRSLNISGLDPKDYQLEIAAEGYHPWKKNVEVNSGIATEFWNVVLVPQKIDIKTIFSDSLSKYAFSPDKKKIAYFISKDDYLSLSIKNESQAEDALVYKEPLNQRFTPEPGELKWSPDSQWLLFSFRKDDKEEIYLTFAGTNYSEIMPVGGAWKNSLANSTENQLVKNKNSNVQEKKINSYKWDSQSDIYFTLDGALYSQSASSVLDWFRNQQSQNNVSNSNVNSAKKDQLKKPDQLVFSENDTPFKLKDNVSGFTFCGSSVCSVNVSEKKLEIYGQGGDLQDSISFPENYQMTENNELFAYSETQTAILDSNGNLFLWDKAQNKIESKEGMKFIFPGVKEVYFSDDGKKLLFSTKNEVYVYSVKDWDVQPKHSSGDLEVVYRDPDELKKVQWYLDYQNIFIENKDGVKMIELDGRGGRNSADFIRNPDITDLGYDTGDKKLWFIEKGDNGVNNLQEISFPETVGLFSGIIGGQRNQ